MEEFKFIPLKANGAVKLVEKMQFELAKEENKGYTYHELIYLGQFALPAPETILVLKVKNE